MKEQFLQAMSRAASSVCVVTTDGPAGRDGVTVSTMTSVSLETPRPSLLICVHHQSAGYETIRANGAFCANLLASTQADVSDSFAGRTGVEAAARFDVGAWQTGQSGLPLLTGALASFECELMQEMLVGSHRVYVGEAVHVVTSDEGQPLVYHDRGYAAVTAMEAN